MGWVVVVGCSDASTTKSPAPSDDTSVDAAPDASVQGDDDPDAGSTEIPDATTEAGAKPSFGVTSCQPAFEEACKPPITLVNGDPSGRGKVFTDAVGDIVLAEQEIACTACSILYRDPSEIPKDKHPKKIEIVLDTHGGVAQAGGDTIQFDLDYIASFKDAPPDEVRQEMLGVLQHETVHLYQNYGNAGTGEGLADLVRARVGYYPKSRFQKGEGTWKDPYTASGNFYSWLTGPCSFHSTYYPEHDLDFPYKLSLSLAGKSGDGAYNAVSTLILKTFGKDVDDLWAEYQATAF